MKLTYYRTVELSTSLIYEPSDPNQTIRSAHSSHRIAINYRFQNLSACSTAVAMPSSRVTDSSVLLSAVGNRVASANLAASSSFMLPLESSSDVMCLITSPLGDFFLSANDKDRALYALCSILSSLYLAASTTVLLALGLRGVPQQRVLRRHRAVPGAVCRQKPAEEPSQRPLAQHQPGHGAQHNNRHDPPTDPVPEPAAARRRLGRRVGDPGGADLDERRARQRGRLAHAHEARHLEEGEAGPVGEARRCSGRSRGGELPTHCRDPRSCPDDGTPCSSASGTHSQPRHIPIASSASAPTQLTHHPPCAASPAAPCTLFVVVSRSVTCLHWRCSMKCLNKCDIRHVFSDMFFACIAVYSSYHICIMHVVCSSILPIS
jgi:hypothetical protein